MNIFGFRPFKGKFNLGNSDDIPTNDDGTLIGAIKQINTHLTANNDAPFRFGYDSNTGKYGFITNEGGADTFNPFSSGGVIKVGSASTANTQIDISSRPDYSTFTVNNFLVVEKSDGTVSATTYGYNGNARTTYFTGTYAKPIMSYNAATGILTITPSKITGSGGDHGGQNYSNSAYIACDVYLVTSEIENL